MQKQLVGEIFWLRAIACLSVVVIHTYNFGYEFFPGERSGLTDLIRMAFLFSTPTFVFISEFLNAKSYSSSVPDGFLKKRVKILLPPYIILGFVYPLADHTYLEGIHSYTGAMGAYIFAVAKNLIFGDYVAYFILIIIQFHILHLLLSRFLLKMSPAVVLTVSFVINAGYLMFFNLVEPSSALPMHGYIWGKGYWIPFPGWIFYFALGYYCGKNYDALKMKLEKYRILVLLAPILFYSLSAVLQQSLLLEGTSKRFDMLLYTTSMIFLIIYLSSRIKTVPRIIYLISNYSFSIFLLHLLFFYTLKPLPYMSMLGYQIYIFIVGVAGAIIVSFLINKLPFGKFIVGNVQNRANGTRRSGPSILVANNGKEISQPK
ncbi:acyltransferase family protein [Paenibacillus jiagnxiensis]|uniref:acyltransferase family protein n=1 Tax=Paenibacillus jiagnxiensis TaxID=3228926 RepID=UPI0033BDBEAF